MEVDKSKQIEPLPPKYLALFHAIIDIHFVSCTLIFSGIHYIVQWVILREFIHAPKYKGLINKL